MTHLLKQALFSVCLLTGAALATSCSNNKDLFDQNEWNKMMEESFPVSNIQTSWQTIGTATANVTVNEDAGTYTIKVYDCNPISNSTATLLATGTVENGSTWTGTIDYPLANNLLYVTRIDSKGRREVSPVLATDGGTVTANFGTTVAKSSMMSRADGGVTIETQNAPFTENQVNELISKATDATTVSNLPQGGNTVYKIGNYTGNISYWSIGSTFYLVVTGKWTISSLQEIGGGLNIIVANGGELVVPKGLELLSYIATGKVIVMPGGKLSGEGQYTASNGAPTYNGGTISVSSVDNNGGVFYNADGATLNIDNYQGTSTGSTLINQGSCTIKDMPSAGNGSNSTVKSGCLMTVTNTLSCVNLYIGDNSSVECGSYFNDNQSSIHLGTNSMLQANNRSSFQNLKFYGPSEGYAIFYTNGWNLKSSGGCSVSGNIYIDNNASNNETGDNEKSDWQISQFDKLVAASSTVKYVDKNTAFSISSSKCHKGYAGNGSGGQTTDTALATTYCFEDNYPNAGDYDFNDAVFDISKSIDKKIVTLNVTLRAVGASLKLAGAIRLNGIESKDIVSVSSDNGFGLGAISSYQIGNGGIVIPLFDDAHKALSGSTERKFLNTEKSGTTADTKTLVITITCQSTSAATSINFSTIDPFIDNGSYEIHTYPWSNNAALGKVATALEYGKFVWAIAVPSTSAGSFKYPYEYQVITGAYPDFATWAQNTDNTAWYSTYDSTKVHN